MICPNCGTETSANFCPNCGQTLNPNVSQNQNNNFQNGTQQYNSGQNYNASPNYNAQQYYNQQPIKKKHSGLGIAAFVVSFFGFLGIVGAILGIIDLAKDKFKEHKHGLSIAAIVIGLIMFFIAVGNSGKKDTDNQNPATVTVGESTDSNSGSSSNTTVENNDKPGSTNNDPGIPTADDYKDMTVGDIGVKGDVYIGLSYVKRMTYLPTALGENNDITAGHEVILAFFDFYNNSDENSSVRPGDITCYADGVQVEDVENYIKVECDGIKQYYSEELADHTQMISVQDYEVPTGWTELKFFYKSELIWAVGQDDVKTDDFKFSSMYDMLTISREETEVGTVIYDDGYEVIFQGVDDYVHNNIITGDTAYTVFKFTINNTGTSAVDYGTAGHSMTAYLDNYFAGDATYTMDDKIDGYSNIFNIDSVEIGMSANIYVAFEGSSKGRNVYMVYDDGYISDHVCGTVYVER